MGGKTYSSGYYRQSRNSFNRNDTEYQERRKRDEQKTRIIESFMDNVYKQNDYHIKRITETTLQKKGVDIVHIDGLTRRKVDEKYAITYYNKDLFTFSFEIYSRNNPDCKGWLLSDYVITDDYAVLWFKADDDFTKITSYDLCIIPKKAILDLVYDAGFDDDLIADFLNYWEHGQYFHPDPNYSEKGEGKSKRLYYKLDYGITMCQSVGLAEQPINLIIPKKELVKLATHRFKGGKQ